MICTPCIFIPFLPYLTKVQNRTVWKIGMKERRARVLIHWCGVNIFPFLILISHYDFTVYCGNRNCLRILSQAASALV